MLGRGLSKEGPIPELEISTSVYSLILDLLMRGAEIRISYSLCEFEQIKKKHYL